LKKKAEDVEIETTTNDERHAGGGKRSTRTCVGCGKEASPDDLVRVVVAPTASADGAREVAFDLAGGSQGRGGHVHPSPACLERAAKGGLAKAFKCKVHASAAGLAAEIMAACERRIVGLIAGAKRGNLLAAGAEAACDALEKGAPGVIIATDAGNVVKRGPIEEAVAEGRAVAWGDKASLGAILGRGDVAVIALMNESVAAQIARARAIAGAVSELGKSRSDECRSREAR
jgi:hypothetical protein